jgi:hypothetical protein
MNCRGKGQRAKGTVDTPGKPRALRLIRVTGGDT